MSGKRKQCGQYGGRNKDGSPCKRRVGNEGDRCPQHPRHGEPAPAGRPEVEFTDEQIKLIEKLAGLGLTQADIADCLPVSERRFAERIRDGKHPKIASAYARGRARDKKQLTGQHHKIAMGALPDAGVSDQRKALEWRLERQHKYTQEIDVGMSGAVKLEIVRRVVRPEDADA